MRFSLAHSSAVLGGGAATSFAINDVERINFFTELACCRNKSVSGSGAHSAGFGEQTVSGFGRVIDSRHV